MFSGKYSLDLRPQAWKRNFLHLKRFALDTYEHQASQKNTQAITSIPLAPLNQLSSLVLPNGNGQLELEITFSDPAATRRHEAIISRKSLGDWLDTNNRTSRRPDDIQVSLQLNSLNGNTQNHTGTISTKRLVGLLKRSGIVPNDYRYVTALHHYALMRASISVKPATPRAKTYGLKPGFVSQIVPQWLKQLIGYQENRDDWGEIVSISTPKSINELPNNESLIVKGLLAIQERLNKEAIRRTRVSGD
jgi:hypothetical protein